MSLNGKRSAGDGPVFFALTHTDPGGLRELWCDVAGCLRERGNTVQLVALYPDADEAADAVTNEGWHYVRQNRPSGVTAALALFVALIRFLRAQRPAVVVTAAPAANVVIPLAVISSGCGARVVITHHTPSETYNAMLDRMDAMTGRLACIKAVVSVSNAVSRSLDRKPAAYRAKRLTIPNALPEPIESLIKGLRRDRRNPGRRIVALGRLAEQKNYPMLIRAMADVPDAILDIIGDGEDRDALSALASEVGAADRIRFLGYLPRTETLGVAAQADVFVQVSLFEGHSLALIEAAKLGLPLVVSNAPVQIESVTAGDGSRCGIVVPLGDAAELARALVDLLGNQQEYSRWAALSEKLGKGASRSAMVDSYATLIGPSRLPVPPR